MKCRHLILLSLLLCLNAFGSDRVGNGGFAYVCRDDSARITSARLLDLWETEDLKTWSKNDATETQIETILEKIKMVSPNARGVVGENLKLLRKGVVYTDRTLSNTDDAFPPYEPAKGCAYEQVARYEPVLSETGKGGLRINREIFNSGYFSNSDRAALFIHEAVYMADRSRNGAKNSQRTRTIVAHLFSDSEMPNAIRMAIGGLIGFVRQSSPTEKEKYLILAAQNPLSIGIKLSITALDGLTGWTAKDAPRDTLYQCELINFSGTDESKTGWVSPEKIVGDLSSNDKSVSSPFLMGTSTAGEFSPARYEIPSGATVSNSVIVQCDKKTNGGESTPVSFEGYFQLEESAQCLTRDSDGSLGVRSGKECFVFIKRSTDEEYDFISSPIEVVRAL